MLQCRNYGKIAIMSVIKPVAPSPVAEHGAPSEQAHEIPVVVPVRVTPNVPLAVECGGRDGPEPTRFGDWERAGRCIDF